MSIRDVTSIMDQMRAQIEAAQEQVRRLDPRRVAKEMVVGRSFDALLEERLAGATPANEPEPGTPALAPDIAGFDAMVERYSQQFGVDPAVAKAVMRVESGGYPHAQSPAGAAGLMQLMPETARGLGVTDPFDPEQSVRGGTEYLRTMLDRFGDLPRALAAYTAGPGAVEEHGGIPPYPETQDYVRRVLAEARRLSPRG